jgi:hypothetical protein
MGKNSARENYFFVPYKKVYTCGKKSGTTEERSWMQSPKTSPPLLPV